MSCVDNLQHVPTTFTWSQWGNHICIAGSFDPPNPVWTPIDMNKNADNVNEVTLSLMPDKKYFYKFVIDGQWVLDPTIPSYPDESGNNYNHVIEVEPPPPPPIPSEEEKMTVEDQTEEKEVKVENLESEVESSLPPPLTFEEEKMTVEDQKEEEKKVENLESEVEPPLPSPLPSEEEKMTVEDQKEEKVESEVEPPLSQPLPSEEEKMAVEDQKEEEKAGSLESEVHQKEHYHENQVVNEDQELHQNVEEQVEGDIQKEQHQHEKEQVLSEVQIEENQHEKDQVFINGQKEHYQHHDDQATATKDDQKKQHLHGDDQIVHQHEVDKVLSENHEKTEQMVDEVHSESAVTTGETTVTGETTEITEITESSTESSEAVQTEQSRYNSVVIEESLAPEIEAISSVSTVKQTIIESDNEKVSAERVANNESIMDDTVIDEETPKESQYTSSASHDDSMDPVTPIEKEINVAGEVNSEQTKEEMSFSNQDEGISLITTITQEALESVISDVNDKGLSKLSNEVKVQEDITEQSVVVEDDSTSESKVTEFIEDKSPSTDEKQEQTKDILTPSSVKISDSTTETHSTETLMPSSDMNHEVSYEPELVPINENEDDNYDDDYDDYDEDDYEDDYENNFKGDKKDNNNEHLNYEDILKEAYIEGVSPETMKEVILNNTWAKDDSMDETIPNTWLETRESTAYIWSESTQAEWLNQEQVINAWTSREENAGTHKSEHVIEDKIPSMSLVEETVTEQAEIPTSTNVNENLESTLIKEMPAPSTTYNNESNMENKTRKIVIKECVGENAKENGNMTVEKLVIKENISTSEVKIVAEPSSVQYEKPESSATAYEVSSMSTTVIAPANDQDMTNADVLKATENQESLGINIPAGKISQRKISQISPSASSPGESTRNADMYAHNITVATNTTRENKKSKSKKPPIEITSRDVLQRDPKFVKQHDNLDKIDFSIIYLITSVATTFTLGIISMLFKSVIGPKRNK